MLLTLLSFCGSAACVAHVMSWQFGPALMRCFAAFSSSAVLCVAVIVAISFIFGRFYCGMLCPMGIMQDIAGFIAHRPSRALPDLKALRYAIAALSIGLLLCGWTLGFKLLDPYSNFGRVFVASTIGGAVPFAVIFALALWKKRIYCVALCPVGTILGLFAKYGIFRLQLTSECVQCGKCVKSCPAGCIDIAAGRIDNERCVRCMNCIAGCPKKSIVYSTALSAQPVAFSSSRRAFLRNSGIVLAGLAAGVAFAKAGLEQIERIARKIGILPPGAGDAERFAAKCTACQLCTQNCPAKIITPSQSGIGPVVLDLSRGACQFDCNRCGQVCPTGAIRPLKLIEKQHLKIAEAEFNPQHCIVFQQGEPCGKCAEACPVHAIRLRKNGTPRPVNTALCIGCGACQAACPATTKAMTVHAIEKQIVLES